MSENMSNKELLDDVSFDRTVAPRDEVSNLMVSLLNKRAFDEKHGKLRSDYPLKDKDLKELVKLGIIECFTASPEKLFLSEKGRIVAYGEYSMRKRESKK